MLYVIWSFIRHNSGIFVGFVLLPFILIYAYSCQSVVISSLEPGRKVTRAELIAEVDFFLAQAESKIQDLDRQDLVKGTIFNSLVELAQGGTVNPAGIALVIGNILGLGAVIDNVRKRTFINTIKGDYANGANRTQKEASSSETKTET